MAEPDSTPASPDAAAPPPANEAKSKDAKSNDAFVRNTLARFATAVVGIPILLWMLFLAPWWVFPAFCILAIVRGAHELFRMTMVGAPILYGWGFVASLLLAASLVLGLGLGVADPELIAALGPPPVLGLTLLLALPPLVTAMVGVLLPLLEPEPSDRAGVRLAWLVAGPLYVGTLLGTVPALFVVTHGGWVVLAMGIAWGSDTGAYFAGRFFGKHKLAPRVSPSKTVEGALGGLAASVLWTVIAQQWFLHELPLVHGLVLAVVANVLGQLGDLAESLIKRSTGVKDSGSILPGHGGLLDRIDALMFTTASCLLYVLLTR